ERMRSALDRGEFKAAADEGQMMGPVLGESMNRAASKMVAARKEKAAFVARRTPCLPGESPDRKSGKPRILPGAELESYYPAKSKREGEQGTVVLRVKVDRAGCGESVATVVRSGITPIDEAALSWFETARFAAAWKNGAAVDSDLMFKV